LRVPDVRYQTVGAGCVIATERGTA